MTSSPGSSARATGPPTPPYSTPRPSSRAAPSRRTERTFPPKTWTRSRRAGPRFDFSVTSLFKPKDNAPRPQEQAEINIFTAASGLLYERFASIVVLRNTKSTVKFWFIENLLSPSFLVRIASDRLKRNKLMTHPVVFI
ncbi:hypothetical protein H0H92_005153 [Tricholoma furcatifolium]|nr:hypothetical protein H0H92_005153 [Tricholoma furcatifolium]